MNLRAAWESELRKHFKVHAGQEFVDWLWENIVGDFTEDEISDPRNVSETLSQMVAMSLRTYEGHLRFRQSTGAGGRSPGISSEKNIGDQLKFDPKTRIQVMALSEYLAKIASVERRIMEFRRRFLGETTKTLSPDEIPKVLKSWSLPDDASTSEEDVFIYWAPDDQQHIRFRGTKDSAIGRLDRLGEYFAERYPWSKDQVMHFVLCDWVPQVNTVRGKTKRSVGFGPPAHGFNRDTITLEIEAWMSPEMVKKAYTRIQRDLHEGRKNRRGEERNIEIFRFVLARSQVKVVSEAEHLGKLVLTSTWRSLREAWDNELPAGHDWRYGERGARNFPRDFERGQMKVTGSKWGLPGVPGQPMTQAEAKAYYEQLMKRWGVKLSPS